MIVIEKETIENALEEMKPLLEAHYLEVHAFPDKIAFNPDYEKYLSLEKVGMTHLTTVRDDGVLVGYCLACLVPNMHYKDHVYAMNDVIYVDPKYRHSWIPGKLLEYAEAEYKRLGASVMTIHMKIKIPFDALCKSVGLDKVENIYMKYIGE